jgi:hypothetical protein
MQPTAAGCSGTRRGAGSASIDGSKPRTCGRSPRGDLRRTKRTSAFGPLCAVGTVRKYAGSSGCAQARLGAGRCRAADATPRCAGCAAVLALGSRRKTRFTRCARCAQTVAASQSTKRAGTRRPQGCAPRRRRRSPAPAGPKPFGTDRSWGRVFGKPRASSQRLGASQHIALRSFNLRNRPKVGRNRRRFHFSGENDRGTHRSDCIFVRFAGPPLGGHTPCATASARIFARSSTLW